MVSRERTDGGFVGLRATALIAVLAGAVGSVGLMLHAGRRNNSRILLTLFALWGVSPFVVLVLADVVSTRWSALTRNTLYSLMLILTLGSLAVYGDVAPGPPKAEVRFRIRCGSAGIMAAYCNSRHDSRADIRQAVTSMRWCLNRS